MTDCPVKTSQSPAELLISQSVSAA